MTQTIVKWPSRSRPALFLSRLPLWLADPTVRVLVTIDADDPTCNNADFIRAAESSGRVSVGVNERPAGKVAAINHGVAEAEWSFLILAADDWKVMRPDYASHLRRILFDRWPDGDGVLHLNDGRAGLALNTGAVMGRRYFDRFGYIYHPSYTALWCDNELGDVAESLGRSLWVDEVALRHEWTDATGGMDDLFRHNESFYDADMRVYLDRKARGFPQ